MRNEKGKRWTNAGRRFGFVSLKHTVCLRFVCFANRIVKDTKQIMSTTPGVTFTSLDAQKSLPNKFFVKFLEQERLKLLGAEDITCIQGPGAPNKMRLEKLYKQLQSGEVKFVWRSTESIKLREDEGSESMEDKNSE